MQKRRFPLGENQETEKRPSYSTLSAWVILLSVVSIPCEEFIVTHSFGSIEFYRLLLLKPQASFLVSGKHKDKFLKFSEWPYC